MARAKRPQPVPVSDIHETRGFDKLPPHVRAWLQTLRPVAHKGIRAWVATNEYPFEDYDELLAWTPDQIQLAIDLFRPHPQELAEFVGDQGLEEFDEEGHPSEAVWQAIYEGRIEKLWTPADSLFGLSFAVDGMFNSSSWHWAADTLSDGLGILCTNGDHRDNYLFPCVVGVIDRSDPIKSAALLLREGRMGAESFLGDSSYDELHSHGLLDEDVYRLILAGTGRVRPDVLTANREYVRDFKPAWAKRGLERIIDVMRKYEPKGSDVLSAPPLDFETPGARIELPRFEGYPYLLTRLAPALYNLIVLPAGEEDLLIDTAQGQSWANRLPTCLVLSGERAIYYDIDGSPSVGTEPPKGGIVISGYLAPVREFEPTAELRARQRSAAQFVETHRPDGYVMGDLTKGGYRASQDQLKSIAARAKCNYEFDAGRPIGLSRCRGCGDWRGQCLDPNPALEGWVVAVSCFCDNDNRCAACGELLYERRLAANYYNPSDGKVWHVPGFTARCGCAEKKLRRSR